MTGVWRRLSEAGCKQESEKVVYFKDCSTLPVAWEVANWKWLIMENQEDSLSQVIDDSGFN